MVWPAVIAAGAALAGGAMQHNAAVGASTDSRHFAREMWNKQLQASNTAHQRQVKDMRAAGLNPILSVKQGGASTPSPMGYQTPQFRNIGADAIQAATAAHSAQSQRMIADDQTALARENQAKVRQEVKNLDTQNKLNSKQIEQLTQLIINAQLEADRISTETDRIRNSGKLISTQEKGQDLKNQEQSILMELLNKHEIFKIVKDFGWKGAAAAEAADIVESAAKNLSDGYEVGKPGSKFHFKMQKRTQAR